MITTYFSDHDQIKIKMKWMENKIKGEMGISKLNVGILNNDEYIQDMEKATSRSKRNLYILIPVENRKSGSLRCKLPKTLEKILEITHTYKNPHKTNEPNIRNRKWRSIPKNTRGNNND